MLSGSKYNFILIFAVTDEEKLWIAETTAVSMNKQIFLNRTTMSLKLKNECQ